MEKWLNSWTTEDEKKFIDQLGNCSPLRVVQTNRARLARTKDYLHTIKLRSDWGSIDREAVAAHARARVLQLTERIQQYPQIQ
jgi:hypothetical protein